MKAILQDEYGTSDVLRLEDVETPVAGRGEGDFGPRLGRSILPRMGDLSRRAIRHVSRLSIDEQRDLLRDLTAPSVIRADAIRQFRERPDGQRMAEVLTDLESDEPLRLQVVDELRRSLASPGGQRER